MDSLKIAYFSSRKPRAQKALEELRGLYGEVDAENAEALIILGGDGTMLRALHEFANFQAPLFGMNLGTLGFMLNPYNPENLIERIRTAKKHVTHPLRMRAIDKKGKETEEIAFNEISLLRETHNSAKIKISVNDQVRIPMLVADGVLVSTPVGSTAYNSSAGGPILPLDANLLPITPISAFRPRRWPGALLRNNCKIRLEVLQPVERPVSATADAVEVRDVREVHIKQDYKISKTLLFDPGYTLEERIYIEQFAPPET